MTPPLSGLRYINTLSGLRVNIISMGKLPKMAKTYITVRGTTLEPVRIVKSMIAFRKLERSRAIKINKLQKLLIFWVWPPPLPLNKIVMRIFIIDLFDFV